MTDEEKRKRACENSRRYYQAHKEEILQKQAVYRKKKYAEDEEYRKKAYTRSRKWVEKNKERVAQMKKDWHRRNCKPTKDEIIEWLEAKIMWLKDTLADREDYEFHLECLVEEREKEIQEKEEYIKQLEENNQNMQDEMVRVWTRDERDTLIQECQRYIRCIYYLKHEIEGIERIIATSRKTKKMTWMINQLHTLIIAIDSLVKEQTPEGDEE